MDSSTETLREVKSTLSKQNQKEASDKLQEMIDHLKTCQSALNY
jgi:hypothetical protein